MPLPITDRTPSGETPRGVLSRTSRCSRLALPVLLLLWGALVVVRLGVADVFAVPSASMEPTLVPGQRILVDKRDHDLRRGDVVVFDGAASFEATDTRPWPRRVLGAAMGEWGGPHLVKRVIGLPGDRIRCCDARGHLTLDGSTLDEPYLYPGDTPSDVTFDVTVPPGRLWVMGDHRSRSADSRSRLGRPGGGLVPLADVTGTVTRVIWPLGRATTWQHPSPHTTTGGDR